MASPLFQPLNIQVPIVDPRTGTPTAQFQRLLQELGLASSLTVKNGEISLADIAAQRIIGSIAGGTPEAVTISQVLDWIGNVRGSIIYRGAAGWAALAPGTSGHFLKTNGAGADPAWAAGGSGETLIGEFVSTGVTNTHTFAAIPGTFRNLRMEWVSRSAVAAATDVMAIELNGDAGANYDATIQIANNGIASAGHIIAGTPSTAAVVITGATAVAGEACVGSLNFVDYAGTAFRKTYQGLYYYKTADSAAGSSGRRAQFTWRNAAAIAQIKVTSVGGNFVAGSKVRLYGIP